MKSFSVGLLRTLCAYFVCVLSVLHTVSVLVLHSKHFSSSAITPCHVLTSSVKMFCACVRVNTKRMRVKYLTAEISTRASE